MSKFLIAFLAFLLYLAPGLALVGEAGNRHARRCPNDTAAAMSEVLPYAAVWPALLLGAAIHHGVFGGEILDTACDVRG